MKYENMGTGWVRLYRSILVWFQNHSLLIFWIYCLLKASHKRQKVIIGSRQVELLPGQFVFGRKKASQETGLSEQQIRTCVASLRTLGNLTIKSTNKYSVITVINWEFYQSDSIKPTSKVTSHQPAGNHIQKCNNVKKNKYSPEAFRLSDLLASLILKNNSSHKDLSDEKYQPTVKGWALYIDRMINLDKRPVDEIEQVIRWCQDDSFWCGNILSGRKLRERYDQLKVKMNGGNQREKTLAGSYRTLEPDRSPGLSKLQKDIRRGTKELYGT